MSPTTAEVLQSRLERLVEQRLTANGEWADDLDYQIQAVRHALSYLGATPPQLATEARYIAGRVIGDLIVQLEERHRLALAPTSRGLISRHVAPILEPIIKDALAQQAGQEAGK